MKIITEISAVIEEPLNIFRCKNLRYKILP